MRAARPGRRRTSGRRGSATVELVLIAPLLVVFLVFMVFAGRVVVASGTVEAAARDAARAASLNRSPDGARQEAQRTAEANLAQARRVTCRRLDVSVDTSRFRPVSTGEGPLPGTVAVVVRCELQLADLSALGMRGVRTVERRAVAPVDAFRGVDG